MSTNQKLSSGVLGGWRVSTKGETRARRTTTSCSNTNYPYIMLYCKPQATLCTPDHPFLLPPSPLPSPFQQTPFACGPMLLRLVSDVYTSFYRLSNLFSRKILVREERRSSPLEETRVGRDSSRLSFKVLRNIPFGSRWEREPRGKWKDREIAKCGSRWGELEISIRCTCKYS